MIRSGTLLIQKGTKLPTSILLKGDPATNEWTAVESGTELLQLKAELAGAGWNYFYMGAVKQTVLGSGPKRIASALKGVTAKLGLNKCNSLQIDEIAPLWSAITPSGGSCYVCPSVLVMQTAENRFGNNT
jgi:hypothetical protein